MSEKITVKEFEEFIETLQDFSLGIIQFTTENTLKPLPAYQDLTNKETMGIEYRNAQALYELYASQEKRVLASFAYLNVFSLQETSWSKEDTLKKADKLLRDLRSLLNSEMLAIRERLRYYQNTQYLVSNFNYGDY